MIFDILRKVLSSKVDRDDACLCAGTIYRQSLNRKIETTLSFILQVSGAAVPGGRGAEYEQKERSRKGQQADALALEGEEGRDKLR